MDFFRPNAAAEPAQLDQAEIAVVLAALANLPASDTEIAISHVFDPELWTVPCIAEALTNAGFCHQMPANRIGLFRDARTAALLRQRPHGDPLRQALRIARLGLAPYDCGTPGGFDDGKTQLQRRQLRAIAASTDSAETRNHKVQALFAWSCQLLEGDVAVPMPH